MLVLFLNNLHNWSTIRTNEKLYSYIDKDESESVIQQPGPKDQYCIY